MTTQINTFQDILDALERDPALRDSLRRYILSDEILGLPARVHTLTEAVEALVGETRLLKAGQEELRAGQAELRADVNELKADVTELKADVTELKADVSELKADVTELKADVTELKAGQQEIRADLAGIHTEIGKMGGDVSRLLGTDYEGRATVIAPRMAKRLLGLTKPTVVALGWTNNRAVLLPEADEAAERGDITWDEADEIGLADLTVIGTNQDGQQVYVIAEVSITVQQDDRDRAVYRAALLERATGVTTVPVVIGRSEEDAEGDSGVAFWQFDPRA